MLNVNNLIRMPERITENLFKNNGLVYCKKATKILFPRRYLDIGFAEVGSENVVFGFFIWVVEDTYYALNQVCARVRLDPDEFNLIKIDEEEYYEFVFDPGSTVIKDINLLVEDRAIGEIYGEFIGKGNWIWGTTMEDACKVYNTAGKYAGVGVGDRPETIALIISVTSRDKNDKTKYYRQSINSNKEDPNNKPEFISLDAVEFAATNTMSRLGGNYFDPAVISSLLDPTTKVERIDNILRA